MKFEITPEMAIVIALMILLIVYLSIRINKLSKRVDILGSTTMLILDCIHYLSSADKSIVETLQSILEDDDEDLEKVLEDLKKPNMLYNAMRQSSEAHNQNTDDSEEDES